jgi:hypothetical protein
MLMGLPFSIPFRFSLMPVHFMSSRPHWNWYTCRDLYAGDAFDAA